MNGPFTLFAGAFSAVVGIHAMIEMAFPGPIVVNDLHHEYRDGAHFVVQDRTVTTDAPTFFAEWRAEVADASTNALLCSGSGSWNYKPGRGVYTMTLAKWTGDDDCTDLPPGEYILRASWVWGGDQTAHESEPFTVD